MTRHKKPAARGNGKQHAVYSRVDRPTWEALQRFQVAGGWSEAEVVRRILTDAIADGWDPTESMRRRAGGLSAPARAVEP